MYNVHYVGLKRPGQDFSREKSAEKYLAVYTKTLGKKGIIIEPGKDYRPIIIGF